MAWPLIGVAVVGVGTWLSRKLASIVAKVGLSTFQTGIAWAIIALQIVIGGAMVSIVALLYNLVQDLLNYVFNLQTSSSTTVSTAVDITKAIGVWDGAIDGLTLVLPFLSAVLLVKLSIIGIRLLKTLSIQADRVIKTALSHGF